MTTKDIEAKTNELVKDLQEWLPIAVSELMANKEFISLLEEIFVSEVYKLTNYENYILPKIILCALTKEIFNQYNPHDKKFMKTIEKIYLML